jgi:hypothetical protein
MDMAFGITRKELEEWKRKVRAGEIAYLTHYWLHPDFPGITSVTKAGCRDLEKLKKWAKEHGLNPKYIHKRSEYPHFDLIGEKQKEILIKEKLWEHIERFKIQR